MSAKIVLTEWSRSNADAKNPSGFGSWLFANVETGQEILKSGIYAAVRGELPTGTWKLLP